MANPPHGTGTSKLGNDPNDLEIKLRPASASERITWFKLTLNALLEERGLANPRGLEEVATAIGTAPSSLKKWVSHKENTMPQGIHTISALARYFDVTTDFLINGDTDLVSEDELKMILTYRRLPPQLKLSAHLQLGTYTNMADDIYLLLTNPSLLTQDQLDSLPLPPSLIAALMRNE